MFYTIASVRLHKSVYFQGNFENVFLRGIIVSIRKFQWAIYKQCYGYIL